MRRAPIKTFKIYVPIKSNGKSMNEAVTDKRINNSAIIPIE